MPITLTITADSLDEFLHNLQHTAGPLLPRTATEILMREQFAAPANPVPPAATPDPAASIAAEAPKRGPGRPKKEPTPAQEAARFKPAEEAKPQVFTVRRYGGATEGEYGDSGTATGVLVGLIHEAADAEALDSLTKENADEVTAWPAERRAEIEDAYKAAYAKVKAEAEQPPERGGAEPPKSGPHFALDGTVLKEITPDKPGAMNGVNAVVAAEGGNGGPGFAAAKAFLESIGVPRVSVLADNDPKLAQIAEWCAQRLGLPFKGQRVDLSKLDALIGGLT